MNSIPSGFRILGVVTMLVALGGFRVATTQAQTAAPVASGAPSTFCGSQPLCYETNDFAATITDFRTSTAGGYKVIDVIVRFQNKTSQPLILGYLANSGTALDDRGNRYVVWGGNGFRGIGQVYGGASFDPKFNIRGGGFGDAQFELMWAPGQTAYGLTFELNLTVDEINTIEGGQHLLGGEFPLHYRGLTNGVSSAAPGQATAFLPQGQGAASQGLPPCGPAGSTLSGAANSASGQVPASANDAVSSATAAISSFGALFGKKKTVAPAAPNTAGPGTASAAPCAPAATSAGTSPPTGTSTTTSVSPANAAGTSSATVAHHTTATPAAATKTAATATTKPTATVAKAPAPPANAAAKKPAATPAPPKPAPVSQ